MNNTSNLSPIKMEDVMDTTTINGQGGMYVSSWWYFIFFMMGCVCLQFIAWVVFIKPFLNNKIINNLKVHNKVAIEGIVGIVRKIDENTLTIDIGNNTNILVIKSQITNIKYIP